MFFTILTLALLIIIIPTAVASVIGAPLALTRKRQVQEIIEKADMEPGQIFYELGCGSCQNLFLLSELFPRKKLVGLDWTHASQEIARELSNHGRQVRGLNFDMLDPRMDDSLPRGSAVLTVHALEQIGTKHEKLLSFLLNSNPSIVVHYEPIVEFYDKNNLLDYLALIYSEKRCHLTGYLTALRKLEREKKVEIIEARRSYLGGVFHESSTLIAWRPV